MARFADYVCVRKRLLRERVLWLPRHIALQAHWCPHTFFFHLQYKKQNQKTIRIQLSSFAILRKNIYKNLMMVHREHFNLVELEHCHCPLFCFLHWPQACAQPVHTLCCSVQSFIMIFWLCTFSSSSLPSSGPLSSKNPLLKTMPPVCQCTLHCCSGGLWGWGRGRGGSRKEKQRNTDTVCSWMTHPHNTLTSRLSFSFFKSILDHLCVLRASKS